MDKRELVRAIIYDIKNGKEIYLLLKTKKGYWQNPQGGINAGENDIKAINREVKEETSLNLKKIIANTKTYIEYDTERKGNLIHASIVSYATRVDSSKKVILSLEEGHTEYKWVSYEEALNLLTEYPEQIPIFKQVVKKLKKYKKI